MLNLVDIMFDKNGDVEMLIGIPNGYKIPN